MVDNKERNEMGLIVV